MFCGDEVKALVVDIGGFSSRFGFAGEDQPSEKNVQARPRPGKLGQSGGLVFPGPEKSRPARLEN